MHRKVANFNCIAVESYEIARVYDNQQEPTALSGVDVMLGLGYRSRVGFRDHDTRAAVDTGSGLAHGLGGNPHRLATRAG